VGIRPRFTLSAIREAEAELEAGVPEGLGWLKLGVSLGAREGAMMPEEVGWAYVPLVVPLELKGAAMAEPERAKAREAKEVFMLDSVENERQDLSKE
jgi:hypothetical protein